ncbi:MAG: hypothetical protein JXB88_01655 [Spirochaetales bacterium]|nr:hypothetical protein [Spirochaetales bacterium]
MGTYSKPEKIVIKELGDFCINRKEKSIDIIKDRNWDISFLKNNISCILEFIKEKLNKGIYQEEGDKILLKQQEALSKVEKFPIPGHIPGHGNQQIDLDLKFLIKLYLDYKALKNEEGIILSREESIQAEHVSGEIQERVDGENIDAVKNRIIDKARDRLYDEILTDENYLAAEKEIENAERKFESNIITDIILMTAQKQRESQGYVVERQMIKEKQTENAFEKEVLFIYNMEE